MITSSILANSAVIFGYISLLSLLSLHFVSAEFKPNFRMISEYALGKHKWLLTLFFFCWGICNISTSLLLWDMVTTGWAKFGVILIFVSGVGAIMGGLFDVQHKLHGLSFGLGVPFLPIGALIISYHVTKNADWQQSSSMLFLSAHLTWVSLILMGGTMFFFFSGLKSAGIAFGPDAPPMTELPAGMMAIHGWANRFLVICYIAFPIFVANNVLSLLELKK